MSADGERDTNTIIGCLAVVLLAVFVCTLATGVVMLWRCS